MHEWIIQVKHICCNFPRDIVKRGICVVKNEDREMFTLPQLLQEIKRLKGNTVGPIGQKTLNKVVSHTDATMTLLDATRRYQTIPDNTRRYQTLLDFQIQQYFGESSLTNIGNSWIRKIRQNEKVKKLLLNLD
jgi:hypothetical protein